MMEFVHWWVPVLACCAAGAAGFGASHWRSRRAIDVLTQRLEKVDKAHHLAQVQTAQTRRQIERLQAELAARQREMAERIRAGQQRVQQLQQALATLEPVASPRHDVPVHGFADTQPMESTRVV